MMNATDPNQYRRLCKKQFLETVKNLAPRDKSNEKLAALYERLKKHGEMKKVWDGLFDWRFQDQPDDLVVCAMIPYQVAKFAKDYVQAKPPVTAITPSERIDRAQKIAKYAKIIIREMRVLGLPSPIYSYLAWDNTELHICDILRYFDHEEDYEKVTLRESQDEDLLEEVRELDACVENLVRNGYACMTNSELSIYDALKELTNPMKLLGMIPEVMVQRTHPETFRRLAIIRGFAEWLRRNFGIEPRDAKRVIQSFAVAVLDDDGITGHTVKDALKIPK